MMVRTIRSKSCVRMEADLHGMRAEEARLRLEALLSGAPGNVTEIVVIHGFSHGQSLKSMVWDLRHPRIASRLPCLNQGQTRLLLK